MAGVKPTLESRGGERLAPWEERWKEGRTTFHLEKPHPSLVAFVDELQLTSSSRVLLPLCGKSVDLAYFAADKKVAVVGVDGVRRALDEFLAEHEGRILASEDTPCGAMHSIAIRGDARLEYIVGDFMHLTPALFGPSIVGEQFTAAFDRGALVAVAPRIAPATCAFEREDRLAVDPVWKDRGCDSFFEATYLLTRNNEIIWPPTLEEMAQAAYRELAIDKPDVDPGAHRVWDLDRPPTQQSPAWLAEEVEEEATS
ncbi:hypothetical protein CTAYLR_010736 [Chrysophaeum taylorii]|uniref:Thiopurine S-methyltransferase n=1 Tax=Chrysophaeum taylorii TaxID=2483200 RepID=A0AAD7U5L0_9STRA|nr:hypothetical protein CTAYLR_010736 [Chrysophaeum taylorii]